MGGCQGIERVFKSVDMQLLGCLFKTPKYEVYIFIFMWELVNVASSKQL